MKENNLREVLEKCSKVELIEIAVELSKYQVSTFRSSVEIILAKRINAIDKKIDENIARYVMLREKANAIPKSKRNIYSGDVREVLMANAIEYIKLNEQREKLEKELYGYQPKQRTSSAVRWEWSPNADDGRPQNFEN